MRINVYSQELTDEVQRILKQSNTGTSYPAVRMIFTRAIACTTTPTTTIAAASPSGFRDRRPGASNWHARSSGWLP